MSFTITNDRLDGVAFVPTPNQGGRIHPTLIVLHDTAGRLSAGSSVSWFQNKTAKVSAHIVVERDGSVTQMVDFDRQAWHAGKSSWRGRSSCNGWAIGIEMVSPGTLVRKGRTATAWFGKSWDIDAEGLKEATTPAHGTGWWMPYTEAQIIAVEEICKALVSTYPISEVVGHFHISPGRKVDPSPLFPFERIRSAISYVQLSEQALAAAASTDGWPLRIGMPRDDRVRHAQDRLKALGYGDLVVDGLFGPATRAAVLAWEAEQGRGLDGNLTADEFSILYSTGAKSMPQGPATAAAKASKDKAASKVEASALTVASGVGIYSLFGDVLWPAVNTGLDTLVEAVSKLGSLGVRLPPRYVAAAIVVIACFALVKWARQSRGN